MPVHCDVPSRHVTRCNTKNTDNKIVFHSKDDNRLWTGSTEHFLCLLLDLFDLIILIYELDLDVPKMSLPLCRPNMIFLGQVFNCYRQIDVTDNITMTHNQNTCCRLRWRFICIWYIVDVRWSAWCWLTLWCIALCVDQLRSRRSMTDCSLRVNWVLDGPIQIMMARLIYSSAGLTTNFCEKLQIFVRIICQVLLGGYVICCKYYI